MLLLPGSEGVALVLHVSGVWLCMICSGIAVAVRGLAHPPTAYRDGPIELAHPPQSLQWYRGASPSPPNGPAPGPVAGTSDARAII